MCIQYNHERRFVTNKTQTKTPLKFPTEIGDFRGSGAHGRIRTFGRFLTGGFLDRSHRPLGHMSIWRRGWDSNPQTEKSPVTD